MYTIGEKVIINKQGDTGYAAKGIIIGICENVGELRAYFPNTHPFWETYVSWVNNKKNIYIVDVEPNIGPAGFLQNELKND
ncbi:MULTISPECIES: hypothetical protein [Bacillaceae]|uniref:Uncharacterized protein n=1 Tax=Evansella alkalicola TaxID=745819 RepID=A0ABS6JQC6_9BACI|nr:MULTISPECIES: hypothetical protein [Bacillaceae]MBU9720640.1 hypothetical protein [Bacillus alkalicola]